MIGHADVLVSIIITNYNYAAFLGDCIESALNQSHPKVEVVVVDDGSSDGSAAVIDRYHHRLLGIHKENGGQGSAFNRGFLRSSGEIVIFLDADDLLEPEAAAVAAEQLAGTGLVKTHWPLTEVDAAGAQTGRLVPGFGRDLPVGDVRARVRAKGPATMRFPPTSGNAWSRAFLDRVLPMDEETFRIGADTLLFEVAPFAGIMGRHIEPLSRYRLHSDNSWRHRSLADQVAKELDFYVRCAEVARRICAEDDVALPDPQTWEQYGWWHRLQRAVSTIEETIPPSEPFALIDDGSWGLTELGDRPVEPFPRATDGTWLGVPADDAEAVGGLDSLGTRTRYVAIGWSSRWWLDTYPELATKLGRPVVTTDDVDIHEIPRPGD
ncbi:MAG: glycosyltransferase family 2 protein [Acidimicrobiales bacterium]